MFWCRSAEQIRKKDSEYFSPGQGAEKPILAMLTASDNEDNNDYANVRASGDEEHLEETAGSSSFLFLPYFLRSRYKQGSRFSVLLRFRPLLSRHILLEFSYLTLLLRLPSLLRLFKLLLSLTRIDSIVTRLFRPSKKNEKITMMALLICRISPISKNMLKEIQIVSLRNRRRSSR